MPKCVIVENSQIIDKEIRELAQENNASTRERSNADSTFSANLIVINNFSSRVRHIAAK